MVIISALIIIVCIFLSLIVLVQNSKGGGLASNFSSSNQYMGVRKTTDFLEKATWTLASALLVLCLVAGFMVTGTQAVPASRIQQQVENSVDPSALPSFPGTAPASGAGTQAPAAPAGETSGEQAPVVPAQ